MTERTSSKWNKSIRRAETSDWHGIGKLLKELYEQSPYQNLKYNEADVKRLFHLAVTSKKHLFIVVADKKNNIYGMCIGQVSMNWWGVKVASELVTYCNAPGWTHKLIYRYKQWAKQTDAEAISFMSVSGENERFEKMIEHTGFEKLGSIYMMEKSNG